MEAVLSLLGSILVAIGAYLGIRFTGKKQLEVATKASNTALEVAREASETQLAVARETRDLQQQTLDEQKRENRLSREFIEKDRTADAQVRKSDLIFDIDKIIQSVNDFASKVVNLTPASIETMPGVSENGDVDLKALTAWAADFKKMVDIQDSVLSRLTLGRNQSLMLRARDDEILREAISKAFQASYRVVEAAGSASEDEQDARIDECYSLLIEANMLLHVVSSVNSPDYETVMKALHRGSDSAEGKESEGDSP